MENDGLITGTITTEIRGSVFNLNNLEALKSQLQTKLGILADDLTIDTERVGNFGSIIKISGQLRTLDGLQTLYNFLRTRLQHTFKNSILKIAIDFNEKEK